ncbi:MAG TPA: hypothetical protein VKU38_15655 [Ktedonobacteraceae bacterium]|nr:hypothetical protein [Ktedonobacteraceae bacterium]
MQANATTQQVIQQKLAAFEQLEPTFVDCFRFTQNVHGQKRFSTFSVADSVRYLHALWVCECKDRLLSIYKNTQRYDGIRGLELLVQWQEGDSSDVVAFLQQKLDTLPFADLTRQLHEVQQAGGDFGLARRLRHGRLTLLNRGMNLMHALDAIFALPEEQIAQEVQLACLRYGHTPDQIAQQLAGMETPLYTYVPHQSLAQRNMVVMNKMGVDVMNKPTDEPGQRSWRVLAPTEPMSPYAEHIILGYQELVTPIYNNLKDDRFIDRPERSEDMEV